jgi:hypothetical protein
MKTYFLPCATMALVLYTASCTKDRTIAAVPPMCVGINDTANTYTLNIAAILNYNCAYIGCHDAVTMEFGINLSTYITAKQAFETQTVVCSIEQNGCVNMPYQQPKLADSLINYLVCWSENGYKQ